MEKLDLLKDIQENNLIDESIKDAVNHTFNDLLRYLNNKNFRRWVRSRDITYVAKNLIYKSVLGEEDEYLKSHKSVAGYHRVKDDNSGEEIVIRKENAETIKKFLRVSVHETIHALAERRKNAFGGFSRFFGEGITEYLSYLTNKLDLKDASYRHNVITVLATHLLYGDSFICSYLTGRGEFFFDYSLIDLDDPEQFRRDTYMHQMAEEYLENFHLTYYKDDDDGSKKDSEKEALEVKKAYEYLSKGRQLLRENFMEYAKSKIRNQEYFTNGKIDFDKFFKDMLPKVLIAEAGYEPVGADNKDLGKTAIEMFEELSRELIEHSYFNTKFEELDDSKIKENVLSLMKNHFNKILSNAPDTYYELMKIDFEKFDRDDFNIAFVESHGDLTKRQAEVFSKKLERIIARTGRVNYRVAFQSLVKLKRETDPREDFDKDILPGVVDRMYSFDKDKFKGFASKLIPTVSNFSFLDDEYKEKSNFLELRKIRLDSMPGKFLFYGLKDGKKVLIVQSIKDNTVEEIGLEGTQEEKLNQMDLGFDIKYRIEGTQSSIVISNDTDRSELVLDRGTSFITKINGGAFIEDGEPETTESAPSEEFYKMDELELKNEVYSNVFNYEFSQGISEDRYVSTSKKVTKYGQKVSAIDYKTLVQEYFIACEAFGYDVNRLKLDEFIDEMFDRIYPVDIEKARELFPDKKTEEHKKLDEYLMLNQKAKEFALRSVNTLFLGGNIEPILASLDDDSVRLTENMYFLNKAIEKEQEKEYEGDFFEGLVNMGLERVTQSNIAAIFQDMTEEVTDKDKEEKDDTTK